MLYWYEMSLPDSNTAQDIAADIELVEPGFEYLEADSGPVTIESLYSNYFDRIAGLFRTHGWDRRGGDAESMAQNVFLRVVERWDQLDSNKNAVAWLYTIARNMSYDNFRRKSGGSRGNFDQPLVNEDDTINVQAEQARVGSSAETEASSKLAVDEVRSAVSKLPDTYRIPLELLLEGHTQHEIAKRLGIKEVTVRGQVFRARRMLQSMGIGTETDESGQLVDASELSASPLERELYRQNLVIESLKLLIDHTKKDTRGTNADRSWVLPAKQAVIRILRKTPLAHIPVLFTEWTDVLQPSKVALHQLRRDPQSRLSEILDLIGVTEVPEYESV